MSRKYLAPLEQINPKNLNSIRNSHQRLEMESSTSNKEEEALIGSLSKFLLNDETDIHDSANKLLPWVPRCAACRVRPVELILIPCGHK